MLAACSSRPPAALGPVASVPGTRTIDLLVSTTRRPSSDPAVLFGGDRTLTPRFASLTISIPPGHKVGDVAWSAATPADPRVSFATTRADVLEPQAFSAALRRNIRSTGRSHVLVFVHGYNTRLDEAAFRFAQIINDSNSPVTPVLYSWASWGSLAAYPYDRTSASIARDGLESLLADLARDSTVSEVSVLAHSMGGWLAMESLRQMAIRNRQVSPKIRNLMLAAPDIDVDVAQEQARGLGDKRPRITLFVSRDDNALRFSNFIWGSRDRLGAIDPGQELYKTNLARFGVEVIDLTDIESMDRTRHGKFAQSPEVVRAIGGRLAGGQRLSSEAGSFGDGAALLTQGTLGAVGRVLTAPLTIGRDSEGPEQTAAPLR
jgi:esterase/lipase superfamily enzyme